MRFNQRRSFKALRRVAVVFALMPDVSTTFSFNIYIS